ncbi:MAG: EF-Tu/IF-2/RF-3 family GTPase [Candidatus Altiarchaeota archaeon]
MSSKGNVTVVLGAGLGPSLGRKGTESDVTLFNHRHNDVLLSFVAPTSYPEKIQSLASALNIADQVLLKVDAVDSLLGEMIVAIDAYGLETGYVILGGIPAEAVEPLFGGTVLSSYPKVENQVVSIRDALSKLSLHSEGEPVVQVDHCFPVKGVGTVALGVVKEGVLRKHDSVLIYPKKIETLVKSIQVHDTDVAEAGCGVCVGVALKDVKPDQVERGSILSTRSDIPVADIIESEAALSKYARPGLEEGDQIMVNSSMNYTPASLVSGSLKPGGTGVLKIKLEKQIPLISDRILLLDPNRKNPRIIGYVKLE